ncbi:MAG: DNA repair protein RadC [Bacillota bacterium]|nr:DNA repair protein RadC [Bacillota bacterium]
MIRNIPEMERPVEKMLRLGRNALSNSELIACVIRSGTRSKSAIDLAHALIGRYDDIRQLSDALPEELTSIEGIGTTKACQLMAAFELGRRAGHTPEIRGSQLTSPSKVADFFRGMLGKEKVEKFAVVMLNVRREVVAWEIVSIGTLNSSLVHPREVFKNAIRRSAQTIVAVHNHPSGNVTPSQEDDRITERLVAAGNLVGIPLVDHVIVSETAYYSYLEHNRMISSS